MVVFPRPVGVSVPVLLARSVLGLFGLTGIILPVFRWLHAEHAMLCLHKLLIGWGYKGWFAMYHPKMNLYRIHKFSISYYKNIVKPIAFNVCRGLLGEIA